MSAAARATNVRSLLGGLVEASPSRRPPPGVVIRDELPAVAPGSVNGSPVGSAARSGEPEVQSLHNYWRKGHTVVVRQKSEMAQQRPPKNLPKEQPSGRYVALHGHGQSQHGRAARYANKAGWHNLLPPCLPAVPITRPRKNWRALSLVGSSDSDLQAPRHYQHGGAHGKLRRPASRSKLHPWTSRSYRGHPPFHSSFTQPPLATRGGRTRIPHSWRCCLVPDSPAHAGGRKFVPTGPPRARFQYHPRIAGRTFVRKQRACQHLRRTTLRATW